MLDFLQALKNENLDCIMFFEGEDEGSIRVEGQQYKDPGNSLDSSQMGEMYHIMLMRDDPLDPKKYTDYELFEAILVSPLDYISRMIQEDWYGIVARKTTTSDKFINLMVDKMKELT